MAKVNNKRIVKNSFYLYVRMIIVMAISLYTVRAILDILGVVDYGIYNVIGGVVILFSFLNRTLSTSSQRYFSIELAKGNIDRLNRIFSLNINLFLLLGIGVAFLLETIGLWFVNTQLTIPSERLFAANIVYQFSIISFLFHIVSIPYVALVIAQERMAVFAYLGVAEAIGKLAIVFILMGLSYDKLIMYGLLILFLSAGIALSYVLYCRRNFKEINYYLYWDKSGAKELLSFSSWHLLGTSSMACRSQGINILLNMFFDPTVNAARAIAFQVNSHINQLASNFFVAVKPQIYKTYANGDFQELYKLLLRSCTITTFLVSMIIFPIWSNTGYVLGLWLKEVPVYAVIFCRLTLINGIIDSTNGPMMAASLATGKIRRYMLSVSTVMFANIPISYFALKLGGNPEITMVVSIVLSFICVLVRAFLLKLSIGFPLKKYSLLIGKIVFISVCLLLSIRYTIFDQVNSFLPLLFWSLLIIAILVLFYACTLDKGDRLFVINLIKSKLKK